MKLYFATTNIRKYKEAVDAAKLFKDIEVEHRDLDILEIQSDSAEEVAIDKSKKAFAIIGEPTAVTDTYWSIPALNGFPGAYMKEVHQWLSVDDWLGLMAHHKDRTAIFSENVAYFDGENSLFVAKDFSGRILTKPRGKAGTALEMLAEFDGQTLAEAHDGGGTSHKAEDFVWVEFFEQFKRITTA